MQNSKTLEAREAAQRLAANRRARRGIVAGYLHELSGRHADAARRPQRPAAPVLEPARSS